LLSDEVDFEYFQGFDRERKFLHSMLNLTQEKIADTPIDKTEVIVDFFVKIEFLFFVRI